jgi:dTDP-glucose pyrophosphorylase/CBS domain-containing protein
MGKNILDKIKSIQIDSNQSILSALKQMDTQGKKLLVVFENDKFKSLISLGDIQRAIIDNTDLNAPIRTILRANIKVAKADEPFTQIKQRMLDHRIECMPVVDQNFELIDVYFWEDAFPPEQKRIIQKLDLPVVIMAGGKGTRLKPLTNVLPKPLIPVGEKTILEDIMDRFIEVGCEQFFISVNYKAEMIKHYFSSLVKTRYNISYFEEYKPLGTAGSLYLLRNKIIKTFFVSNCDIIIDTDYGAVFKYHQENNNELTVVSALKNYPIPYGTIETGKNGKLIDLKEKPELTFQINTGMYILEPHLLNEIPENDFFHITNLIDNITKRNGKVGVFPISEGSWKDIGDWAVYSKLLF